MYSLLKRLMISLLILILLIIPGAVRAQDSTVLTFNPPVNTIELSGPEPVPDGVDSTVFWAGGGIGGPPQRAEPFANPGPYWASVPASLSSPVVMSNTTLRVTDDFQYDASITKQILVGSFVACGYTTTNVPKATLTYPSGRNEPLNNIKQGRPSEKDNGKCWHVEIPWTLGMERGVFTLTLDHEDGQLVHQWGIDYPRCGVILDTTLPKSADPKQTSRLIMGYVPNETITINIYTDKPTQDFPIVSGDLTFVAQRKVKLDDEGAALLNIKLSRSSPLQLWLLNYYFFSADGRYYDYDPHEWFGLGNGPSLQGATFGGFSTKAPPPCAPDPYLDNGVAVPLYNQPAANATKLADLAPKVNADIVEEKALTHNGRVVVWYHVLLPDKREGWIPALGQLNAERPLMFGAAYARVLPNQQFVQAIPGSFDPAIGRLQYKKGTVDFNLYQDHDSASTKLGVLTPGTIIQLKQGQEYDPDQKKWITFEVRPPFDYPLETVEDIWWEVTTPDGKTGWTHVGLGSVAWGERPESSSAETSVQATSTVGPTATLQATCTKPSTRLTVGGKGQVMPPKTNRLRKEPGGEVVGKLPVGDPFTVLDGPQCTPDGNVWWKVDYKGLVGWTVEGSGTEFWVEPVK